ncbi:subtilisin-like protein [Mycena vulgaris]|nr:subtilisin-like protein [Mycena vulgaris]
MWVSLVSLLPLAVVAFALPSKDCEHKVKESIAPPRGWTIQGPAPLDHIIKLRIALPQSNFQGLEDELYKISDPYHERYGAHLSQDEISSLVAPRPESVNAVNEWLASHGIQDGDIGQSPAGDWLTIRIPVALVEKMLDTKYHVWKHTASGDYIVRTTSYSLPKSLHEHIELVQPTTMFGTFKKLKSTIHSISEDASIQSESLSPPIVDSATGVTVDATCNTTITITCLKEIYNAVGYTPSAKSGIQLESLDIWKRTRTERIYRPSLLIKYQLPLQYLLYRRGIDSQNLSLAGGEANLDVQFAFGVSFPIASTFYSTAGRPTFPNGSAAFIPDIGTPEDTNEPYTDQTVPESFAKRACAGFAQLGARGVSLMFSSGDGGVGDGDPDPATQECLTNDGLNRARFPCVLPIVLLPAVGGTILFPEQAVDFSGGGFSDYFSRPSYQDAAVKGFLSKLPKGTYSGLFNPNGRAFPDVAAQSDFFRVFVGGRAFHIGGTSGLLPCIHCDVGFVALLNDGRLKKGLPPLGFLNPLLYSKAASGFNDITVGSNPGCGTPGFNSTDHFFDRPNFAKLLKLVT